MATSSSTPSTKIPPFMFKNLQIVGNEMEFPESQLTLLPEKMTDFESLKANGFDVKPYFSAQGWDRYFEMLNGPIYPNLLKKFWMKARVFTRAEAKQEELAAIERDPSLKGKTRKEMGLLEFTGTQIRSNVCGINLTFSKIHFNALLGLENSGLVLDKYEKDTRFREDLLHRICVDMTLKGKVKGLTDECRVLFKIILSSISPRVGGTDTISWTHRHLIYVLLTERKVNLGDYFFERICEAIFLSKSQRKTTIVYPRLLSDLLFQGRIVGSLKKFYPELVACKITPEVMTGSFLTKMHLINTKVVQPAQEFSVRLEDRLYVDGYPLISELDAEHIIQDYLKDLKAEGFDVTREMIPKAPVNMYNPKRKSKRKADTQEDQRTKRKHEDAADKVAEASSKNTIILDEEENESDETQSDDETESDEETLGAKLQKKQVPDSKGPSEADVVIIDNPASESPKHSTIPYISPTPSDLFGNLSNQLYNDLLRLSEIKNRFLVCPSDVDAEVSSIKAKVCHDLDLVGEDIKAVVNKRDLEVVNLMREGLARVSRKRLTMFNHEETERARIAAVTARETADEVLLNVFKNCWVDSKLFKSLEAQMTESERLAQVTEEIAQEAATLHQEDVLMLEAGESSSGIAQAPVDADQLRVLQEAIEQQRADHQNLESKVDTLDSKVDTLNDKFDIIIALLKKP
ncbi:uncharacterized protein LOC123892318 [Trifolium pratense]|uniref:uncharacterized protein LOC123892318 n=1 Tax=Trifolium pratense TaxID=57577 RepID=UPI001E694000|nr:uncharacterized protein LOC123892318 [Trifolium pratense]